MYLKKVALVPLLVGEFELADCIGVVIIVLTQVSAIEL